MNEIIEITDEQKHEYLLLWHWQFEQHDAGFTVYFHNRFPGVKYKLNRAYEKMKSEEPSSEPVLTVSVDDPAAADKIRALMEANGVPLPPPGQRENPGLIYQVFGDPVKLERE